MEKIILYLKESYSELVEKVTWPTWANLLDSARVVVIATLLISLIIFVMDLLTNTVLDFIYSL
ncbi:MAG TPA: preprotein translocase subunit SecE [Saprospiraceae bacterium]|nr:preprotein translocase subunit SecE [Saprospiraceae bacterium]